MKPAVRLRSVVAIFWALALAILVPLFFFNYGGRWLLRVADLWPLGRP